MPTEFIWPIRVYYEDTDAGGVVFYANYLKFFERARTEWLNHLSVDQASLLEKNIAFAVKHVDINYRSPARLNQQLEVVTNVIKVAGASLLFEQLAYIKGDRDKPLCEATVKVVSLTIPEFTPCRIPANIMEEIQRAS
jgi:acyl-CoA thioester hydrolase